MGAALPELGSARFSLLASGWDSIAIETDGGFVFKFPRHPAAVERLEREARILEVVRPAVSMAVPEMTIHHHPRLFSCHRKLPGEHLLSDEYAGLGEAERDRLADDLALFYAELHDLSPQALRGAGALPIEEWAPPEAVIETIAPHLSPALRLFAEETVREWGALAPDPHGETYGFFDGHGWNMAFDFRAGVLAGIYDFADSGFGPLQQEFVYSTFISADLTRRLIGRYSALTGRVIDRRRVATLTSALRLSELGGEIERPEGDVKAALGFLQSWFETVERGETA